ncbi:hypothetical protein [Chitinophaga sp.]|uniref:hypothetical protein n=1 Tax=Chitinophaga sp. TaxID=1869181 RepID=UPI002F94CDA6
MKKHLLAALSLSMLLFGCSKDQLSQDQTTTAKKIPLKISLTDFIQKLQTLPSPYGRKASASGADIRDSSLDGKISDIYVWIDSNIGEYAKIHQRSQDQDFGVINQYIPDGTYNITVFASSDSLVTYTNAFYAKTEGGKIVSYPDIFTDYKQINVNGTDTARINMQLQRQTAMLEVNITDAPAAVADSAVKVRFALEYAYFYPYSNLGIFNGYTDTLDLTRRDRTTFNSFVLNTSNALTVEITYPDKTTGAPLKKLISHVTMNKNAKTLLTGSLYDTPPTTDNPNSGFNIRINDIWDPTQVINF